MWFALRVVAAAQRLRDLRLTRRSPGPEQAARLARSTDAGAQPSTQARSGGCAVQLATPAAGPISQQQAHALPDAAWGDAAVGAAERGVAAAAPGSADGTSPSDARGAPGGGAVRGGDKATSVRGRCNSPSAGRFSLGGLRSQQSCSRPPWRWRLVAVSTCRGQLQC